MGDFLRKWLLCNLRVRAPCHDSGKETYDCARFAMREMAKMETIDATIELKSPILESAFGILGKQCFQLQLTEGCVLERLS